jgi:4-hydroxybenzoate polyprenyltransferase
MPLWLRIVLSVLLGGPIALGLLIAGGSAELSQPVKSVLLWNVSLFVKLAGNGPLLGYDS